MTEYLNTSAANDLLAFIRASYFGGLIGWSEAASRLESLAALCRPGDDNADLARRVLMLSDFQSEDVWSHEPSDDAIERETSHGPERTTVEPVASGWDDEVDFPPYVLQLIPAAGTGLSDWIFHQADRDFFPSIPHGHWQGHGQPKLDPYTGFVFNGSKQTRREKRKKIVSLWNDQQFRDFARKAIDFYLSAFPDYRWRVPHPRRLPRRR